MKLGNVLGRVALLLLFLVTGVLSLPLALWLTDPMTRRPVEPWGRPFPILTLRPEGPSVLEIEDTKAIPTPEPGATYLVPDGAAEEIVRTLWRAGDPKRDGGWVLQVKTISPGRQRIELYWMADSYNGGVYEATASTVTPLYRKVTGPGYAFVFGPVALALNGGLWGASALAVSWYRRRRGPEMASPTT